MADDVAAGTAGRWPAGTVHGRTTGRCEGALPRVEPSRTGRWIEAGV
ncbi:hypothetical protein ACI792_18760 [Blastococcus sp. SYSU DS0669]